MTKQQCIQCRELPLFRSYPIHPDSRSFHILQRRDRPAHGTRPRSIDPCHVPPGSPGQVAAFQDQAHAPGLALTARATVRVLGGIWGKHEISKVVGSGRGDCADRRSVRGDDDSDAVVRHDGQPVVRGGATRRRPAAAMTPPHRAPLPAAPARPAPARTTTTTTAGDGGEDCRRPSRVPRSTMPCTRRPRASTPLLSSGALAGGTELAAIYDVLMRWDSGIEPVGAAGRRVAEQQRGSPPSGR